MQRTMDIKLLARLQDGRLDEQTVDDTMKEEVGERCCTRLIESLWCCGRRSIARP